MAAETEMPVLLSCNLLTLVKTSQDQNGLRHNDHHRYRNYCTRRLQRLYTLTLQIMLDFLGVHTHNHDNAFFTHNSHDSKQTQV